MNITQEAQELIKPDEYVTHKGKVLNINTRDYYPRSNWPSPEDILKDKLKTTPSAGLTFIGRSFNINKIWKRVKIFTKI
jgi:hypothetical protein